MSCCETPYSNFDLVGDGASSIAGLSDVALTNLANDEVLKYNSTTEKWENGGSVVLVTAYKTDVTETFPSDTEKDLAGFTTDIDTTGGAFTPSTGEFTAPRNGYYRLNLQIFVDKRSGSNMRELVIRIMKDTGGGYTIFSEFYGTGSVTGATVDYNSLNTHQVISLNSGNKIKIELISRGQSCVIWGFSNPTRRLTFFSIEKI